MTLTIATSLCALLSIAAAVVVHRMQTVRAAQKGKSRQ